MATKKKNAVSTPVVTVLACELHRILSNAMLFVSKDATLPMITGVSVEVDGNARMMAIGNDRFRLGCSWINLSDDDGLNYAHNSDGCRIYLAPDDVKLLIKTARGSGMIRSVTMSQNYDSTTEFAFSTGDTVVCRHFDHQFPQWRRLMPKGEMQPRKALGINNETMAALGKVKSNDSHGLVELYNFDTAHDAEQRRPYGVRIGNDFLGLVMPYRLNERYGWPDLAWLTDPVTPAY